MTRQEYMQQLAALLAAMPEAERRDALDYYEEYFDAAGPEKEAQTIQELGSPQNVAEKIWEGTGAQSGTTMPDNSMPEQGSRRRKSPVWIVLAILAILIVVLLVFIGAFFPIAQNTMAGVEMVDSMYLQVGKIYKARTWDMLRHIVFPASMPAIMAGIKIALSSGWMVVVAAEMLASKSGLGFLIIRGQESFDIALVLVGMVLIGIIGALLSTLFSYVERWICPWMTK